MKHIVEVNFPLSHAMTARGVWDTALYFLFSLGTDWGGGGGAQQHPAFFIPG